MAQGVLKTAVFVIIWEVVIGFAVIMCNTVVFGYVEPTISDIANKTDMVNYDRYQANITPIKTGANIALFIFAIIPLLYVFVRLWFKREQTAPLQYNPTWCYPGTPGSSSKIPDNLGGCHVGI